MEHAISFPGLGLEFDLNRVAANVFGKDIYWYGIIICAGFVLAALYVNRRVKEFGVTSDNLMDCLILCVPIGIVCARIYYVAFEWDYYSQHPGEIIAVWNGGIAIYGAVIGVVITLYVYSRVKKVPFAGLCDLAAFGLLIGQCIGRWGNFVNGEAHGGPTDLPWGMSIDGAAAVHPTFLYESLWNLVGFVALHFYSKKRKFPGEIALLYVAWYGLGRAWIEGLRTDSLYIGTLRVSQVLAAVSCIVAVALLVRKYNRLKVAKAFYVPPKAEPAAASAAAKPAEPAEPAAEAANTPAEPEEKAAQAPAEAKPAVSAGQAAQAADTPAEPEEKTTENEKGGSDTCVQ